MTDKTKLSTSDGGIKNQVNKSLESFSQEFGKVLDPVAFLNEKAPALCAAFLKLHELTLNEGAVSKKHKFLMHAAITAALHDEAATTMHISRAIRAGASKEELQETAYAIIPVAGMPAFALFLSSWKNILDAGTSHAKPN